MLNINPLKKCWPWQHEWDEPIYTHTEYYKYLYIRRRCERLFYTQNCKHCSKYKHFYIDNEYDD